MVRVCIVDLLSVLVENLKFKKVDALLEQIYVAKVLNVK